MCPELNSGHRRLEFIYFFAMAILYSCMAGVPSVQMSVVHQGTGKAFQLGISSKGLGYLVASQRNTSCMG